MFLIWVQTKNANYMTMVLTISMHTFNLHLTKLALLSSLTNFKGIDVRNGVLEPFCESEAVFL